MSKISTLPIMAFLFLSTAHAQSMDYGAVEQLFGEPATMSATGSPQRVADVPANMTIVTRDDIRRSGARDIPSILRHVAGVDVLQWANDNFDISTRGYNQAYSARTLVLVDGRQVYADSFGFTPWSALPVELGAIRQIEVVKGANAALFGFNAVAGVINIITDNPRYEGKTSASLHYGSQNMAEASGVARLDWGPNAYFRISGGYRSDKPFGTSNPLPVDGSPRRNNNRTSIDGTAVFLLPKNVELQLNASHSQADQTEVSGGYKLQTSEYATSSILARLSADTEWGLVRVTGYNNWFGWTRSVGFGNIAPKLQNQVTVVQAEDILNVAPDHTIRFAAEYRHNDVASHIKTDGWVAFDAGSAAVMWNWQILPNLSWTSALRYDNVSYDSVLPRATLTARVENGPSLKTDQWSYNAGLVWNFSAEDTLRLIASRGVQLPNLIQVRDAASGQMERGTQPLRLRPTVINNYETLWNRRLDEINARLQIAVFLQNTFDILSTGSGTIDTPGSPGMPPVNVGTSRAVGVEIGGDGRLGDEWGWSASYRFEAINDHYISAGTGRTDLVNYEGTTPQHLIKAGLNWTRGQWQVDGFLQYQSETVGLRRSGSDRLPVSIHPFAAFDARLAYRFTDAVSLAVSGQNLFNGSQQQTSGPDVERQIFLTLSVGI